MQIKNKNTVFSEYILLCIVHALVYACIYIYMLYSCIHICVHVYAHKETRGRCDIYSSISFYLTFFVSRSHTKLGAHQLARIACLKLQGLA